MKRLHKKTVLLSILAVLGVILFLILFFLWPVIRSGASVKYLEEGLYAMEYPGDYGLEDFLDQGGGDSDMAVAGFVIDQLFHGLVNLNLQGASFGCSTLSVSSPEGARIFGRNFDWGACTTLIVQTQPKSGYASVSTVNMDFLNLGLNLSESAFVRLMSAAAPYAPMDGMNEKGLCVAVLMIEDRPGFQQDSEKPDLTTTTAVRLLLDKAADVEEALALLEQYDLHASAGMMVHFAIADAAGRSVAVEYIDNEMSVVETPVVTNFYLTSGEKYGIGTEESHRRYEILMETLADHPTMSVEEVRDATPIYYYEMCGQMKTMLDRVNPLYPAGYAFRDIYLLAAAADTDRGAMDGAIQGLEGWIACFEKARLAGTVFGGGAGALGTIQGNPALKEAYEMGRNV